MAQMNCETRPRRRSNRFVVAALIPLGMSLGSCQLLFGERRGKEVSTEITREIESIVVDGQMELAMSVAASVDTGVVRALVRVDGTQLVEPKVSYTTTTEVADNYSGLFFSSKTPLTRELRVSGLLADLTHNDDFTEAHRRYGREHPKDQVPASEVVPVPVRCAPSEVMSWTLTCHGESYSGEVPVVDVDDAAVGEIFISDGNLAWASAQRTPTIDLSVKFRNAEQGFEIPVSFFKQAASQ